MNRPGIEDKTNLMLSTIEDKTSYRIVRKIADGGMGSVFEAIQDGVEGFEKRVAIKTLLPKFLESKSIVQMFIQEAKLVADLVHENIVQIYQLGLKPEGYYIVIEYVHGISLHDFIRHHSKSDLNIPIELAVFITSRIARGLAYAHSRLDDFGNAMKIVHRDVCPKNVLITTEGLPKLADFGLAIVTANENQPRAVVGKVLYMSPEQAKKEPVDFCSDIFSLGALLFELLSKHPIRKATNLEDYMTLARDGAVDWKKLPNGIPSDLVTLLMNCLAYNRADRPQSTSVLARSLEYFIYKSGYGPTIQTLEEYLRKHFSVLYQFKSF